MKLLAFADIHSDIRIIPKLLAKIRKEKPEVIVCAGDISTFGSGLKRTLEKFNIGLPFLIIPGNHETPEELDVYSRELKSIKNIHLKSVVVKDILFIGCGGGGFTEYHAEFEQSEKEFAESIKKLKISGHSQKVVLVAHQPPYKTKLDYLLGQSVGSKSIRTFIEKNQPDYCITGHIHENFGKSDRIRKTIIISPGPAGRIIEI